MSNGILANEKLTERSLIESIVSSFYILDYGLIKAVNPDKTIDVIHAKQLKTYAGQSLKATVTTNIEVLTLSGAGFSINFDYKKGDKVLLLGLKNYIKKVEDVTRATETTAYMHYSRETLKAIPMCVFNDEAKVTIAIEDGNMAVKTEGKLDVTTKEDVGISTEKNINVNADGKMAVNTKDVLTLDGDDNGGLCITPELVKQLGYLTTRVDTIINALKNSQTAAQDGGATYKAGIVSTLATITNKENFSNVESDKVKHGKGQ